MAFYFTNRENLLLPEHMITAKFSVPEKVVCDGFAGKLITLISNGEILNPHYINLHSVSSTWNTTRPCRTDFFFLFLFFQSFQHSLEGQLALPWCIRGTVHTQLAVRQNLLGKGTEEQQHSTESSDENWDKVERVSHMPEVCFWYKVFYALCSCLVDLFLLPLMLSYFSFLPSLLTTFVCSFPHPLPPPVYSLPFFCLFQSYPVWGAASTWISCAVPHAKYLVPRQMSGETAGLALCWWVLHDGLRAAGSLAGAWQQPLGQLCPPQLTTRPLLTAHASRTGHVPHPPAWDRGAANFPTPVWHFRGRLWLIDKKLFCPGIFASVFLIFYAW